MKPLELVGQSIDKYEVLEEVGHGGMAVVFRGIDRDLSREVAIKVLHAHLADRGESKQRLHREAITVARLRHPNIVEIYDYANPDSGLSYIVTEFIHGQTLRHWLEDGWQPRPLLAALIVYRLCEALEHAHDLGIVHRDIKPENVMIRSDGWIKLMDFGIAQLVDHQKLTMTGQLLGSPAYMAPELISGKPIDARTDIFALGILLYQLATGQLPFNGRNPHEVLSRIASTEYSPPSAINPRVDEHLEQIIAKALAREPQDRFQSSKAFALELTRYVEEMGLTSDGEELERFFVDPTTVLPQLDQKICDTLVERGKLAADAGQSARALRLLSRVLDFEPQHPIALNLVTQVQERGRRLRQVTLIAAAAGLVGVVAAAYLLMSHPTPQDSPDLVAQANADRTPALAPTPAVLEISTSQDSEPTSADSAVTAGSSTATSLATDGAQQAVSPRETDARSDSARPSKPQQTGNNEPPQVKKPDRADVDDAPEQARCQLRIEGIPVPSRSSYVVAGAGPTALPVPALPSQALELAFATPSVTLQLASANPGTASGFESVLRVEASDCSGAQAPLVLRASIKPARLHFVATNFPLENLVVRCLEGCGQGTGKLRLARDFSALELPPGILEQGVAFEFKADGYRTVSREYRLHPGDNELRIELQEVE